MDTLDSAIEIGTVKVFYALKGFGFISRQKGKDVFFHFSDILTKGRDSAILEGDKVKFILTKNLTGKLRAEKVCRIS